MSEDYSLKKLPSINKNNKSQHLNDKKVDEPILKSKIILKELKNNLQKLDESNARNRSKINESKNKVSKLTFFIFIDKH